VNAVTDDRTSTELLVDELAREIEARIVDGRIPLGSWLRQQAIAREFGVSRTPVREALQQLQGSGMIELIPYRGGFVRGPTPRQIRDIHQVRAELEGLAAELACARIHYDELERMRAAAAAFEQAVGRLTGAAARGGARGERAAERLRDVLQRENDEFHGVIHEAAANEPLRAIIADISRRLPRNATWRAVSENPRSLLKNIAEHAAILDAVEAGDGAAARACMTNHLRRSGEVVADWLEHHAAPLAR
jgi:DNA-binding GntR family transcriptional regulator